MNFLKSTFAVVVVSLAFMSPGHAAEEGGGDFGSQDASPATSGYENCDDCTLRNIKGPRATQRIGFNSPVSGAFTGTASNTVVPAAPGQSAE